VVERDPGQPVGRGVADELEVRGAAADDDTEGDHGVVPPRGQLRDHDRELEGAGDADDHRLLDVVVLQGAQRPVEQAVHHRHVPAGGHDTDPEVAAVDGLLVGGSGAAHRGPLADVSAASGCGR
jgi:hypothetical protein